MFSEREERAMASASVRTHLGVTFAKYAETSSAASSQGIRFAKLRAIRDAQERLRRAEDAERVWSKQALPRLMSGEPLPSQDEFGEALEAAAKALRKATGALQRSMQLALRTANGIRRKAGPACSVPGVFRARARESRRRATRGSPASSPGSPAGGDDPPPEPDLDRHTPRAA